MTPDLRGEVGGRLLLSIYCVRGTSQSMSALTVEKTKIFLSGRSRNKAGSKTVFSCALRKERCVVVENGEVL